MSKKKKTHNSNSPAPPSPAPNPPLPSSDRASGSLLPVGDSDRDEGGEAGAAALYMPNLDGEQRVIGSSQFSANPPSPELAEIWLKIGFVAWMPPQKCWLDFG